MKLFIDECLSNELVHRAVARGHEETTSVAFRGLAGTQDWNLVPIVVAGDYTLVTKNSADFRGAAGHPGQKGLYKDVEVHAGLICLNGPRGMDLDMQLELFEVALDEIDRLEGDLITGAWKLASSQMTRTSRSRSRSTTFPRFEHRLYDRCVQAAVMSPDARS